MDRRQSLEGIPVLNQGVSFRQEQDTGKTVITVLYRRGSGLLARFQPPVMERNIRLDELGGFVFSRIDNQRDTKTIIEDFAARYRVNRREATLSTVEFLKSLVKRGVISIAIK